MAHQGRLLKQMLIRRNFELNTTALQSFDAVHACGAAQHSCVSDIFSLRHDGLPDLQYFNRM